MIPIAPKAIGMHCDADAATCYPGRKPMRADITITPWGLIFQGHSTRFDLWESASK